MSLIWAVTMPPPPHNMHQTRPPSFSQSVLWLTETVLLAFDKLAGKGEPLQGLSKHDGSWGNNWQKQEDFHLEIDGGAQRGLISKLLGGDEGVTRSGDMRKQWLEWKRGKGGDVSHKVVFNMFFAFSTSTWLSARLSPWLWYNIWMFGSIFYVCAMYSSEY